MDFVKIFVILMILFVTVNLLLTIYRLLNRKWREGLENNYQEPIVKSMICPNGCTVPSELTGNCDSLEKDASGNYYKNCPYECTGEGCQYDQQCSNCGAFKMTGLWDKNGNYIGNDENVQKTTRTSWPR